MQEFLTTREVAALLRVKERKVYELVAAKAIPASRVTGKLLFPRDLVEAWVRQHVEYAGEAEALRERPPVIAGSHDPLLEWAIRESGCGLATYFDGSLDGLERVASGRALGAGMHVPELGEDAFNREHVARRMPGQPVVLIELFRRRQGLVVPAGNPRGIRGVADLVGLRFAPRQEHSGSHLLFGRLLEAAGLARGSVKALDPPGRSEADVALAVAAGDADAGLAIETVARTHRLDFVPLFQERYDLLLWRREYFEPALQTLLGFCAGDALRERAAALGGYALAGLGDVRYNGR
jgi:excisionase family DNA binding protein